MTKRFMVSWVRRGAAAGILEPDPIAGPYAGAATFRPAVTLARDGVDLPGTVGGAELPLIGPGAVLGIDPRAVLRTDPKPGATGVEPNFLPLIELSRPDLPWLFTPARPDDNNRLRPWLVLVVVPAAGTLLRPGQPLPRISVADSELPDLDDAWAWAHAQITVGADVSAADAQQLLRLGEGGGAVSRLLCPRKLEPNLAYLACLVPATVAGACAGLGKPLPADRPPLGEAWTAGAGETVELPVYHAWNFSTGQGGDFKSLVEGLQGVSAAGIAGFGARDIDLSAPWQSPSPGDAGNAVSLGGALSLGPEPDVPAGPPELLPAGAREAFEARLSALLNFPAARQPRQVASDPTLSVVAPPIYGGRPSGVTQVPQSGWLRALNLDPRRRIAAAFGAQFVQQHKETLVADAWAQLGDLQEANRQRALAEMAGEVSDSLYERHVEGRGLSALMALAAPVRTRILAGPAGTLQASTARTPLPDGAQTVAFRRLARPRGPLARRAYAAGAAPDAVARGLGRGTGLSSPLLRLDGIASLADAAASAPAPSTDATSELARLGWAVVGGNDEAITTPTNLAAVRAALTAIHRDGGIRLASQPPNIAPSGTERRTDAAALATMQSALAQALRPSTSLRLRLADRVRVADALAPRDPTARVMVSPDFPAPIALQLLKDHPDRFLPGLGQFPDEHVTALFAQPQFVEAFLAGANHQINRELLWREFPTDPSGTPFRHFWPRPASRPDIAPVAAWPLATPLGSHGDPAGRDAPGMLVLLVRSELVRRYPRVIPYAAPGLIVTQPDGSKKLTVDTSTDAGGQSAWLTPPLLMKIDDKTVAYGYGPEVTRELLRSDLANNVAGWYFVFCEAVTEPRFNFDLPAVPPAVAPPDPPGRWVDLLWSRVPQARGFAVAGMPLAIPQPEPPAQWGKDAADMARIAFAQPVLVAYHADELLSGVAL